MHYIQQPATGMTTGIIAAGSAASFQVDTCLGSYLFQVYRSLGCSGGLGMFFGGGLEQKGPRV